MPDPIRYGLDNPHPLSQMRTELVWEGKYDEYGARRAVDVAGCAMPLQRIETIDEPAARLRTQSDLFDAQKAHRDDFRNMLIWGDNKLVMASLLRDFKGKIDLIYIDPPFDVGADEEHRKVVMGFYRAEPLPNANGLLHGRKGRAFVFVDGIDSILTRDEVRAVAAAAWEAGAKEVHCLAWEFEMDLRLICHELEASEGVQIRLIPIPREIMEKNRTNPPPFLEVAVLEAEPVYRRGDGGRTVDVKLTKFLPSLAEVPSKELEALRERAVRSGFDFIDFWAVDFDWREGRPFEHHWQDYRTRKDRKLKTVSDAHYDRYPGPGVYTACVKVVDVFGCDTSVTVEVKW